MDRLKNDYKYFFCFREKQQSEIFLFQNKYTDLLEMSHKVKTKDRSATNFPFCLLSTYFDVTFCMTCPFFVTALNPALPLVFNSSHDDAVTDVPSVWQHKVRNLQQIEKSIE